MAGSGTLLGQRYRLDERVGGGAMGEVWRGTDTALDRTIAVKVVRPELLEVPGFRERFLAEARTMARIRHPGVVGVHDYHSDDTLAFLVMEYVTGESLAHRLGAGRLDPRSAMLLVAQAAEALQAAHDTGVVHRDVKPGNLLVTPDQTVVLTDFGIARSVASAPLTATGAWLGTVAYLAPEQVLGKPATPRSDLYALGVVGYECLAGRRPFDGENPFEIAMKRVREAPPRLPPEVPPAVREVVERALAADPEHRWPTAAAVGRAARLAAGAGPAGRAPVPAHPAPASPAPAPPVPPHRPPHPAPPVPPHRPPPVPPHRPPHPAPPVPPHRPPPVPAHRPPPPAPPHPAAASTPVGYARPATGGPAPAYPGTGYAAPAYPVAGYLGPPPPRYAGTQQNTMGLLAMIFGIVGIPLGVCCWFGGLPLAVAGIVLGVLGMRKAAEGLATNRGMALAGVICGAVGVVLSIGAFVFSLVSNALTVY